MEAFDTSRGSDLEELADEIYGASAPDLDTGRIVARPISIHEIWADVAQPRRAVPATIRMHWNGNAQEVRALLEQWHKVASTAAGRALVIEDVLTGRGAVEADNAPSVFTEYLDLLRLAQSIHADGLVNPITIVESDGRLVIESGERRWLAYHLLAQHVDGKYERIPAAVSDGRDFVWRQATENTQRRQLNAIGMARQLALLIMVARTSPPSPLSAGREGEQIPYRSFQDVVTPTTCDRRYYAQVADGNVHRIPRGMGERIQGAMNLSEKRLADYRSLLHLTDDALVNDVLWVKADIDNWPEGWLREVATLPPGKVLEVIKRSEWTFDDLRALKTAPTPPLTPPRIQGGELAANAGGVIEVFTRGQTVWTRTGVQGTVLSVNGRLVKIMTRLGMQEHYPHALRTEDPAAAAPAQQPSTPTPSTSQPHPPAPSPQAERGSGATAASFNAHMGELVQVVATEEVGVLGRQRPDGQWSVKIGASYKVFDEEELLLLGIEAEEAPAFQSAHTETATTATADEDTEDVLSAPIVAVNSKEYRVLCGLRAAALALGEEGGEAESSLDRIINTTGGDARLMAESGSMTDSLARDYEVMSVFLARVLEEHITKVLQAVQQAGEEG